MGAGRALVPEEPRAWQRGTSPKTGDVKPNHLGQESVINSGCLTAVTDTGSSCEGVMGQSRLLSLSKEGCILPCVFTQSVWEINAF